MSITNGPNLGLMVNGNLGESHYSQFMSFLRGLDGLVQCVVKSATTAAQPGSPTDGDCYILPASSTGAAWAGNDGKIARYSSVAAAWEFYTPKNGWRAYAQDTALPYFYAAGVWTTTFTAFAASINGAVTTNVFGGTAQTSSGTQDGTLEWRITNLSTGVNAIAQYRALNDATLALAASAHGSGRTGTHFGTAVGNYAELAASGASCNGLMIGCVSTSKPVIIGSNTSEVARFTGGTLSTDSFAVKYTVEATSSSAAAFTCAGGAGFAKKIIAAGQIRPGTFTVATLPAGSNGDTAFATDGRKVGEGAGVGTGSYVVYSNGQWRRLSDETTVAA